MKANENFQGRFYLKPGELYTGSRPDRVTTVVGSCVAVTMYHQRRNVAVMCHAMQPACSLGSSGCRDTCWEKFKVVPCAIAEMIETLRRMGIPKEELEVKLFGGSEQFAQSKEGREFKAIGRQNIRAALDVISDHGIRPDVVEVGGEKGRKLIFDTNSGAVFLKRIGPLHSQNRREAAAP